MINKDKFSRLKSLIAWAVLNALSGYHTFPAFSSIRSIDFLSAGSAGIIFVVGLVSTTITPTGIPPKRARPTTTPLAQAAKVSVNELLSNRPSV